MSLSILNSLKNIAFIGFYFIFAVNKMSRADEGRLIHLAKKREREKEDIEQQLRKLEEDKEKCMVKPLFNY